MIITTAKRIEAAGNLPKIIDEYFGRVTGGITDISIAKMQSPAGWTEPGQTPDFDEYTTVLTGSLRVETRDTTADVPAGQGVLIRKGEWVRYSSPAAGGAEYVAICLPAFSLDHAHRDAE